MATAGEYGDEKAVVGRRPDAQGRDGVPSQMRKTARSLENLAMVMKDTVVEVADELRNGGKQSLMERTQGVIEAQAPRFREALRHFAADIMLWMHQGGLWRTLLVSAVGMISLTAVTSLTAFMLVVLVATANAVFLGLLMSLSAVGAFMAMFFTSLTLIYIGALIATAFAIGTVAFMAMCAVLFVTGWIAFAWVAWAVVQKSLGLVKSTLAKTGNALNTAPNAGNTRFVAVEKQSS